MTHTNHTPSSLPMTPRAIATRARLAAQNASVRDANRAAIKSLARLMEGCATVVSFDGEGVDERVVFSSTVTGRHSLDVFSTDGARFVGHLEGFLSSQPDTGGGWFRLRALSREEREITSETCDACMSLLPVPAPGSDATAAYVVTTDFGTFCSMGCAIGERDQLSDATGGDA